MAETSRERLARIRAEQDAIETLSDEVQASIDTQEWQALIAFNTYCTGKLGLTLEFYRRKSGKAAYRLRPQTPEEAQTRAEDWVEDNL